jgi:hypothetical protein
MRAYLKNKMALLSDSMSDLMGSEKVSQTNSVINSVSACKAVLQACSAQVYGMQAKKGHSPKMRAS